MATLNGSLFCFSETLLNLWKQNTKQMAEIIVQGDKIDTKQITEIFEEILSKKREIIDGALRNEVVDVSVILNKAESLGIIFEPKF